MDSIPRLKHCTKCELDKPLDQFAVDSHRKDGLFPWCRVCRRAYGNARYAANPDVRAKAQEYARRQRERIDTHSPEYIAKRREYSRRHSQTPNGKQKNRERHHRNYHSDTVTRRYTLNYHRKRFPIDPAYAERCRATARRTTRIHATRKTAAGGSFTQTEWDMLCAYYDHRCLRCGEQKPLTVDHVIPVSLGGSSDINNLQPLCGSCNSAKSNQTIDYRQTTPEWMGKI